VSTTIELEGAPQAASWRVVLVSCLQVLVAAAAMTATLPGRTHSLGLITEPLQAELQMARTPRSTYILFPVAGPIRITAREVFRDLPATSCNTARCQRLQANTRIGLPFLIGDSIIRC